MKDAIEFIKVHMACKVPARKTTPTSCPNVWCSHCKEQGHYASKCAQPPLKQVQFVDALTRVYYIVPEEEEEDTTRK